MKNLGLTVSDLLNEVDYALIHKIDMATFVVMGDLANIIIDHLEDKDIPQWYEDESEIITECESNVVYTISLDTYGDELQYFIQESYYQKPEGEIFAYTECDIAYIDSKAELSDEDMDRIHAECKVTFDIEHDEEVILSGDECCTYGCNSGNVYIHIDNVTINN